MQVYGTLVRRELGGYFARLTGYVIIAAVLFLLGLSFVTLLAALNGQATDMPMTELFYGTMFFWLILLIAAPLITMRTFASEMASGTYETLMTTPVGDLEVVLAKFTSALIFYIVMWLPLLACLVILRRYMSDAQVLPPGPTATTFLGIFLLGSLYLSMGCFASALTRSQMIAAMTSFALGIALFLLSFLSFSTSAAGGWRAKIFSYISMIEHMQDFVRGVVDTRSVIFYASLTVFFLFLTLKVVESRRWK